MESINENKPKYIETGRKKLVERENKCNRERYGKKKMRERQEER